MDSCKVRWGARLAPPRSGRWERGNDRQEVLGFSKLVEALLLTWAIFKNYLHVCSCVVNQNTELAHL